MELLQIQKNAWDLQALQEFVQNHTKIFTSLQDILELLQPLKKCEGTPGTPRVI